ncbi:uncharacterized protein K444DRAFT_257361 [Hyaloscypha bicolor E]|uniref:Uncharacterized protein n=1 Tax=Hyaloscypha bicolor E TaxID=1095630 RepID=A0A2J6SNC9_9HELO|nr:uncharacterized protein K444DRAFT_257361 [Hyaloscypha bicolor E]PMD52253.1 hypothetical protein K444DRAFT_257361 [Hyaloscypha bicolor E]
MFHAQMGDLITHIIATCPLPLLLYTQTAALATPLGFQALLELCGQSSPPQPLFSRGQVKIKSGKNLFFNNEVPSLTNCSQILGSHHNSVAKDPCNDIGT